jgi:hypothetical protein
MKNPYLVRTAAVASLAAAVLTAGYLGMPSDDMQIAPESVAVSAMRTEPAMYFPAGFELKPGADDGHVHEYH